MYVIYIIDMIRCLPGVQCGEIYYNRSCHVYKNICIHAHVVYEIFNKGVVEKMSLCDDIYLGNMSLYLLFNSYLLY